MSARPHARTGRLEFLDVLRAVAALWVAFSHRAEGTIPGFGAFDAGTFRFGQFGVVPFFLCSGFIIPATVERYDSLKRFWINRFYRLFPLYWVAISAVLVLHALGRYQLPPAYTRTPSRRRRPTSRWSRPSCTSRWRSGSPGRSRSSWRSTSWSRSSTSGASIAARSPWPV